MAQKTTIFTFKILGLLEEWAKAFDGPNVFGPTNNNRGIVLNNPL